MKKTINGFSLSTEGENVSFWVESGDPDNPGCTVTMTVETIPLFIRSLQEAAKEIKGQTRAEYK